MPQKDQKKYFGWSDALSFRNGLQWVCLSTLVGVLAGSASALLIASLNLATRIREAHHWIIALLPIAGFCVGLMYHHLGSKVERGNALLLEEIHDPKETVQLRMTPLILLATFMTHLFGGSAGREGTALQTGASLADQLAKPFKLKHSGRRLLLMAGISAGFGSVFGTPLAGAIFGMEVLGFGELLTPAVGPCLIAAFVGDVVTRAWRINHTLYKVTTLASFTPKSVGATLVAGALFGLMAMAFSRSVHFLSATTKRFIKFGPARPMVGGILVAGAVFALGSTRYIGLGDGVISDAFHLIVPRRDFAMKTIFTVVTLGFNFKGGEVTPLFFIGATLGNALSSVLPLPASLLAGMGFVGVFSGAAKTPIASAILAFELFGPVAGCFVTLACIVSFLCSGKVGIYHGHASARN